MDTLCFPHSIILFASMHIDLVCSFLLETNILLHLILDVLSLSVCLLLFIGFQLKFASECYFCYSAWWRLGLLEIVHGRRESFFFPLVRFSSPILLRTWILLLLFLLHAVQLANVAFGLDGGFGNPLFNWLMVGT